MSSRSTAPAGDVAYATTRRRAETVTPVVDEVDLLTGAVVARNRSQAFDGPVPGAVSAVDTGALFRNLAGQSTTDADGVRWISAGNAQPGCLDPGTGTVRAEAALPAPGMGVLGAGADHRAADGELLVTLRHRGRVSGLAMCSGGGRGSSWAPWSRAPPSQGHPRLTRHRWSPKIEVTGYEARSSTFR